MHTRRGNSRKKHPHYIFDFGLKTVLLEYYQFSFFFLEYPLWICFSRNTSAYAFWLKRRGGLGRLRKENLPRVVSEIPGLPCNRWLIIYETEFRFPDINQNNAGWSVVKRARVRNSVLDAVSDMAVNPCVNSTRRRYSSESSLYN